MPTETAITTSRFRAVVFFAKWTVVGVLGALVFTQVIGLISPWCALCKPDTAVVFGSIGGFLSAAMQWSDIKRIERGG